MDIKGLDMTQISQKLAIYVESYFDGFRLPERDSLFQESYRLHFDEVKDSIPRQHHHLFGDDNWFNGASGFIEVGTQEHLVMLLADENYETVFTLCLQEADEEGDERTIIIKDFLA
jgi:hypothetical protein